MTKSEMILNIDFEIVKYDEKYASAIAEMWCQSQQGWMGDKFLSTAEEVINDEKNSIHLQAWLAKEGDRIIGYCNIYEYQEDTGALYIGLLNVRDQYHGRKVGKALVLNAVQYTISAGWDRVDLYTWTGNTEAAPLYKKCGFFWENRDDSTHLMNFIPLVLKNEIASQYLNELDWYTDSIRKIEVKPDGRIENEFDYLQYHWKKNNRELAMEFCRRGRGLRKIETEEYSIEATVENLKLVFGNSYKIKYQITNKTGNSLKIDLTGKSEKNIKFDYNNSVSVTDALELEADFFVDAIEKEQNSWKTHPCVVTDIKVNGKKVEFKLGIDPKFPAKIKVISNPGLVYPQQETDIQIDLENFYDEEVTYKFRFPDTDGIIWLDKEFELVTKPKQRISHPTKVIINSAEYYTQKIDVVAQKKSGETSFKIPINKIFQTFDGVYSGKSEVNYAMGCGSYFFNLSYKDFLNNSSLGDYNSEKGWTRFRYPSLGMPFSDEFNKKPVDQVIFLEEADSITMKALYSSEKHLGIKFVLSTKLMKNGLIYRWLELENSGTKDYSNLYFKDEFNFATRNLFFSYKNELIKTDDDLQGGVGNWDSDKITEKWLFVENANSKIGIIWNDDVKLKFGNWNRFFEYQIASLSAGKKIKYDPIIIAIDNFESYHMFRRFALKSYLPKENLSSAMLYQINDGNPFVHEKTKFAVTNKAMRGKSGEVKVELGEKSYSLGLLNTECKQLEKELPITTSGNLLKAKFISRLDNVKSSESLVFFPTKSTHVEKIEEVISGKSVLTIDNGKLRFSSSDQYAPSIFSMLYQGKEWLASSFPEVKPFSWWSPWMGGIHTFPEKISFKSILEEKFVSSFTTKTDIHGNSWEGIKVEIEISKNELYKGLIVEQYFLTLPNLPVLWHTVVLQQKTGRVLLNEPIETGNFFAPDKDLENCSFSCMNSDGKKLEAFAGGTSFEYAAPSPVSIKSANLEEKMLVYLPGFRTWNWFIADSKAISAWIGDNVVINNGEIKELDSRFYIFSKEDLNKDELKMLDSLKLKK